MPTPVWFMRQAGRYHSLAVSEAGWPDDLEVAREVIDAFLEEVPPCLDEIRGAAAQVAHGSRQIAIGAEQRAFDLPGREGAGQGRNLSGCLSLAGRYSSST